MLIVVGLKALRKRNEIQVQECGYDETKEEEEFYKNSVERTTEKEMTDLEEDDDETY